MHINFNNNHILNYKVNGMELKVSALEKGLEVITHSSLLSNEQIKACISKANCMICRIVRNLTLDLFGEANHTQFRLLKSSN